MKKTSLSSLSGTTLYVDDERMLDIQLSYNPQSSRRGSMGKERSYHEEKFFSSTAGGATSRKTAFASRSNIVERV